MEKPRSSRIFGDSAWDAGYGDTVVLFVVGEEAKHFVLVLDSGIEEGFVVIYHGVEVRGRGFEEYVREVGGFDDGGAGVGKAWGHVYLFGSMREGGWELVVLIFRTVGGGGIFILF